MHLFPSPHSESSHRVLEVHSGGSVYTVETRKRCQAGSPLSTHSRLCNTHTELQGQGWASCAEPRAHLLLHPPWLLPSSAGICSAFLMRGVGSRQVRGLRESGLGCGGATA